VKWGFTSLIFVPDRLIRTARDHAIQHRLDWDLNPGPRGQHAKRTATELGYLIVDLGHVHICMG
jgi:hypothetical protein